MAIFACRASRDFAGKVIEGLNAIKSPEEPELRLGNLEVTPFSDGEFQPAYMAPGVGPEGARAARHLVPDLRADAR